MSRSVTPGAHNRRQSPLDRRRALHVSASADLSACFAAAATAPTGFAELSKVVAAQQRQMDGLIDNVTTLMSAMQTEVPGDMRRSRRPQSATLGALPGASRDRGAEGSGLRMWMQDQLRGAHESLEGKLHDAQSNLCNELRGQLRDTRANLEVKLRDAQHCFRGEIEDTQGRFKADVNSLQTRLSHLEDLIDRDEVSEVRRSIEARLEAHAADVQSHQGALANELRQKFEAQMQAVLEKRPDGSLCREQVAEEVMACVEARLQVQKADDGGALGLFREELRKEAEVRVEAKMTQGFGLTQRLMTELRQELQGQLLQVHEGTKRLAVEFSRSLEAHELQVARAVQYTLAKSRSKGDGNASATEELSSTRMDSMEDRFSELSQQLIEEVQRHLDAQQAVTHKFVRDELQHKVGVAQLASSVETVKCGDQAAGVAGVNAERSQAESVRDAKLEEPAVDVSAVAATIEKQLAACRAASAECKRCNEDASRGLAAASAAMEQRLEEHLAVCQAAADDCQRCLNDILLRTGQQRQPD